MNKNEQIAHAIDIKARIEDVIEEMNNWPKDMVDPVYVATRLGMILSRHADAEFEVKCIKSDN
jgi:hypothetical protein